MRKEDGRSEHQERETFNAGYMKQSIMDIAETVKRVVEQEFPERPKLTIETKPTNASCRPALRGSRHEADSWRP